MPPPSAKAPIIIVRKKVHGHRAHHGGAWKVAYADFVTAMMAFFLVMWLVSQSQDVRAAVASYFKDPGVFDTVRSQGPLEGAEAVPVDADEFASLREAADRIRQEIANAPELSELKDQIEMTVTPEGLRIELVDKEGSSFFNAGSANLLGESQNILTIIARQVGKLDNPVTMEGHTDRLPYAPGAAYGNWELSTDRAHSARRAMEVGGIRATQIQSVRGLADTTLRVTDNPLDPRNRRISIIVKSQAATDLEKSLRTARSK
jgi:chemotaxis protein MotB